MGAICESLIMTRNVKGECNHHDVWDDIWSVGNIKIIHIAHSIVYEVKGDMQRKT